MSEQDTGYLPQGVKLDRVRQLRLGLQKTERVTRLVENHGGRYDVEVGVREEDEVPEYETFDRKTVKAMNGAVEGIYRELVASGEKTVAETVVFEYQKKNDSTP